MVLINDREVTIDDGKRIAVNREIRTEFDTFFFGIQVSAAQKTWALCNRFPVDSRSCASHTMWNMADEYVEPIDADRPCFGVRQTFNAFRQTRPCADLPLEELLNFLGQC